MRDPFGEIYEKYWGLPEPGRLIIASVGVVLQHLLHDLHMAQNQDTSTTHSLTGLTVWSSLSAPIQTFWASTCLCKSVRTVSADLMSEIKIDSPLCVSKTHSTLPHSSTSSNSLNSIVRFLQGTLLSGHLITVALNGLYAHIWFSTALQ